MGPETEQQIIGLWDVLVGYYNAALQILPAIVIALVVVFLFWIGARFAARGVRSLSGRITDDASLRHLFGTLTQVALITVGVFAAATIVFPGLGVGDLVAVLGLTGIAVGFAFKDIFQNFLAGILILSRRPFREGDQILTNELEGTVHKINIRSTELRTYDGQKVIIPNAEIFTNPVTVRTAYERRRSVFVAGIAYDEDVEQARSAIARALTRCDALLSDPAPQICCWEHDDSSINFQVFYWTRPQQADVVRARDQVATSIKYAFDEADIEIPFPYRTVQFYDMTAERQAEAPTTSVDGEAPQASRPH